MSVPTIDVYKGLDPSDERWLREKTDRVTSLFGSAARDVIEIGAVLNEVKAKLGHGYYLSWVAAVFPFSAETARRWALAAETFGQIATGLVFEPTAFFLLAQAATPTEARELALKLAADGHRITAAVARKIIAQVKPDPEPAARPARTVIARETLRLLIPTGQREAHFTLDLSLDPDGDMIVGVGGATGRDLGEALTALVERQRKPAPAPPVIDDTDPALLDWCDAVAGGVARHHGLSKGRDRQKWEDIQGAGRVALLGCCRRFDPTVVRPGSTTMDAFKGWAHQSIRSACQQEYERQQNGGTYHRKRDEHHAPAVVSYGEEE